MENNHNPMEDDGSLDFLKIPADETNKHFNCPETTQQKLINLTFWVCDYIEGVKTKFGSDRTLVKIKMNRDDPDRILHHAIMNILEPIWVSVFTKDTYSCIKGRGIHGAMRNVKRAIKDRENARYCLKIDIRKFYPSIDHDVLKAIIRRKIKCKDTLALLDTIIDSTDGVPIGNYLSQYFANLMLAYFDHWIKEEKRVRYYFRYADDMVFLASTKEELHILLADIKKYLAALKLTLKGNEQIFPIAENRADKHGRGLDFVGFVFYHNQTLMRKSIKQNFCRMAARLNKKLNISARDYKQKLCSWYGWAKVSNSKHLLKTIIKSQFYDTFVLRCKAV